MRRRRAREDDRDTTTRRPPPPQPQTNEAYEKARFKESVQGYQKYSVDVQASLSLLNIVQQLIMNGCLAVSLVLSAAAYQDGKMDVGDFVAVNVWIVQLFVRFLA